MKWIGLTGGIASGKSTVSKILVQEGVPVIDADLIAKQVVEPGRPGLGLIASQFGPNVLNSDGSLNRRELGKIVFGKPGELLQLEKILHPLIQQETARQKRLLEEQGQLLAFYDVPLLFEKKLESQFDGIVVVVAAESLQRQRLKERDGLSEEEISNRLQAQIPLSLKAEKATWVLRNEGTLESLKSATLRLLSQIGSQSEESGRE